VATSYQYISWFPFLFRLAFLFEVFLRMRDEQALLGTAERVCRVGGR
jgi:hypothetical protein